MVQVFTSAVALLQDLERITLPILGSLPTEQQEEEGLERACLELGLGLCEHIGRLHRRSRILLLLHLGVKYVNALAQVGSLDGDWAGRIKVCVL